MMGVFVGIDIGGSHVGVGCISDVDGALICSLSSPVYEHSTFEILVDLICATVMEMLFEHHLSCQCIKGVGIGCPGQCKDGILIGACIFSFRKVPLADAVGAKLSSILQIEANIPTVLINDADAAITAEVWGNESKVLFGSAKNIAMITVGTGIGLGLILNGKLHQGSRGLIEGGHMIINNSSHGRKCSCGQTGCVEAYSSAKNTSIRMFELDVAEERDRASLRASFSLDPDKVADDVTDDLVTKYNYAEIEVGDAYDVFTRAADGDKNAQKILNETVEALSISCINLCRILDPDFIIIGGGMSQAGGTFLSLIKNDFKRKSWTILDDEVKIVLANNAKHSGVIGAALHASSCYYTAQNDICQGNEIKDDNLNGESFQPLMKIKSKDVLNYMHSNSSLGDFTSQAYIIDETEDNSNVNYRLHSNISEERSPTNPSSMVPADVKNHQKPLDRKVRILYVTTTLSLLSASIATYMLLSSREESLNRNIIQEGINNSSLQRVAIIGQFCVASYSLYILRKAYK